MQIYIVMMTQLLVQQQVPMQGQVNGAWKELHLETRLLQPRAPNKAALDGEAKLGPCTACAPTEAVHCHVCGWSALLSLLWLFKSSRASAACLITYVIKSGVQQQ